MLKKRPFLISLLLGLLALFILINNLEYNQTDKIKTKIEQDDWQISQSQSWLINRNQPNQQQFLQAEFMRKQGEQVFIEQPLLILQDTDQLVRLDSEHLQIRHQNLFDFTGNVIVNRLNQAPNQNSRLLTEHLIYNQLDEQLSSPILVKIESQNQITTGVGLIADLKTNQTQLLSEVKTRYVP
ncbi:MAG: LPS export ABC transporter periplasmic protein LptC [Thiomicrospira sp.]|uniref:LPS export ABC transporter periplasmic protein LptC n=1 Tax=Thiomicrospira sp. TaxID=935 RepID=UPI0019F31FCA|nr:LPS export ABC transporter periplasmic protein LptC [Thiomicrospira sp.]MBE0493583.1 LPS export ABC transporter periplasmic protein LptC [Thiomicrospira sp.]